MFRFAKLAAPALFCLLSLALELPAAEEAKSDSAEAKTETKTEAKSEAQAEAKTTAEAKSEAKAEAKSGETAPAGAVTFPVKSEYFTKIEDGYISADEQAELIQIPLEAMGDIFKALKQANTDQLHAAINPDITFKMLLREPRKYRGEVVQLAGVLRFIHKVGIENNVAGVSTAWEGQVSNAEGLITTFISLEPLPEGMTMGQGVRLTGVFLKRHGYLNREPGEKLTICPLVFVQHVEKWSELKPSTQGESTPLSFTILEALLSLLAAVVLAAIFYGRAMKKANSANAFTKKKELKKGPEGFFPKPSKDKPNFPRPDAKKS